MRRFILDYARSTHIRYPEHQLAKNSNRPQLHALSFSLAYALIGLLNTIYITRNMTNKTANDALEIE